jgi:hypothetical protein
MSQRIWARIQEDKNDRQNIKVISCLQDLHDIILIVIKAI